MRLTGTGVEVFAQSLSSTGVAHRPQRHKLYRPQIARTLVKIADADILV
jgi:hypothetical protein